ncbi:MAG: C-factor [Pseudomonadota bacterium]
MSAYQALVLGASGAIGSAFVSHFQNDAACSLVVGLSRQSELHFDLENEDGMAHCAEQLKSATGPFGACQFKWIVDATGALTIAGQGPEKRLEALNAKQLLKQFEVNAVGPALLMKHFFREWEVLKTITRAAGTVTEPPRPPEICFCKRQR